MHKLQQIVGGEMASLPGGRVLVILLMILVSLGIAAGGCGPVTGEPTEAPMVAETEAPEPTATPGPLIVWFEPEVTARLEYEGEAVSLLWQDSDYLVVPLTPQAACELQDNCIRIVTDFKVVEDLGRGEDNPTVYELGEPLRIKVPYTEDDVGQAGKLGYLTLRYWGGDSWVAFTESEHQFHLEGDEQGGWGYAQITEWGDRPIAWGGPD
jgi:hypothetical protein